MKISNLPKIEFCLLLLNPRLFLHFTR